MRDGDISNEAPAIGVDFNSVFTYTPRSRLDDLLNKITSGRWAAFAPLDSPLPGVRNVLGMMKAAQMLNVYYVVFAPYKKYRHLSYTGMDILNRHNIPANQVDVLEREDELLQWIKENNVIAFYSMDWALLPYAGHYGKGFNKWTDLM